MNLPAWLAKLFRRRGDSHEPTLGKRGEDLAARTLERAGCRILARGQRERIGELDLVARDGATYVFVEVKTRRTSAHGEPWEAVGASKQRRVVRAAVQYLQRRRLRDVPVRFDVIGITWPMDAGEPTVVHFADAFPADPKWMV